MVVVFFDTMVEQDENARRVYQHAPKPHLMLGTALVGGSTLSRAIASFFMGLTKPEIPVKMFGAVDEAVIWARVLPPLRTEMSRIDRNRIDYNSIDYNSIGRDRIDQEHV